jgi:hypothetical protein
MNIAESVDAAVDLGFYIVCAPWAFSAILDRARKREAERTVESIAAGRGPSMRRPIDIEWNAKQQSPEMLVFDDLRAFRAHLDALNG